MVVVVEVAVVLLLVVEEAVSKRKFRGNEYYKGSDNTICKKN